MDVRILIPSGAGAPGFGGILECLRELSGSSVFCGDIDPNAYGKKMADGFALMPKSSDPSYFDNVLQKAETFSCNVILPITTGELFVLSEKREILQKKGIAIAISRFESMKTVNDKAALYHYLQTSQLPCVQYSVCSTKENFLHAASELMHQQNHLIVKPAFGNGGRGLRIIVDTQYQQQHYFSGKFANLTTTIDAMKIELPDTFPSPMIISEYLPGNEYSVDALANEGETLGMVIRLRKKIVSGISVSGEFVRIESIEEQVKTLISRLKLHGPIGIQFKENKDNFPVLLEINPRLQGAVSGCRAAGINIPKMSVELALGNIPFSFSTPESGSFNRYWRDVF